ncbi:unnamed protein product [Nippostrongylus brasiliensis]|uniref:E3 SUMO-protein ligase NSE2 n=1 Tax=Nippostrongylus brasiliensis TaxID=27835 RepID=A0A158R285_NIPBR|nr:unnamed protein product [Nippostrongylus brasiliensis]
MIRSSDLRVMKNGLQDVIRMLEGTPLFEGEVESYMKVVDQAEAFETKLNTDVNVFSDLSEELSGTSLQLDKLMKKYNAISMRDAFDRLRSRQPEALESGGTGSGTSVEGGGDEMRVLEVVKSHRDPLGGGQIKDPVKSKHCGHVYDRTTLLEYIEGNRARKAMFYQCPYSLCTNKRNMNMNDMIDCPEFLNS